MGGGGWRSSIGGSVVGLRVADDVLAGFRYIDVIDLRRRGGRGRGGGPCRDGREDRREEEGSEELLHCSCSCSFCAARRPRFITASCRRPAERACAAKPRPGEGAAILSDAKNLIVEDGSA